jgi:hypothetical protein
MRLWCAKIPFRFQKTSDTNIFPLSSAIISCGALNIGAM